MPPVITVENLEFSYGTAPVLRGLDLSVEAGEVVCLLGPNGSSHHLSCPQMLRLCKVSNGTSTDRALSTVFRVFQDEQYLKGKSRGL